MRAVLVAAVFCLTGVAAAAQEAPTVYTGACDGSAAVALDAGYFVAANDDENSLRLYQIGRSDPIAEVDLNPVLKPQPKKKDNTPKEVDIEGAARVGDRIYWIGSHARGSDGDEETSRHRFFATSINRTGGAAAPSVLPPTRAYPDLLKHLMTHLSDQVPGFKLKDASKDSPEEDDGFNIEGLAAAPGEALLIGLRNPRPGGRAIVVPLTNPAAVADGGADPRFGHPERLDLGNRGIRSIERVGDRYVIVAGPFGDGDNDFTLYGWSGIPGSQPNPETGLVVGNLRPQLLFNFKPEALFATGNANEVYLLSDDGTKACKDLKDQNRKTFRGMAVRLAN